MQTGDDQKTKTIMAKIKVTFRYKNYKTHFIKYSIKKTEQ